MDWRPARLCCSRSDCESLKRLVYTQDQPTAMAGGPHLSVAPNEFGTLVPFQQRRTPRHLCQTVARCSSSAAAGPRRTVLAGVGGAALRLLSLSAPPPSLAADFLQTPSGLLYEDIRCCGWCSWAAVTRLCRHCGPLDACRPTAGCPLH